ncbi:MAG: hypothetical protein WCJ01_08410 [Ignavibacteria bacterium]
MPNPKIVFHTQEKRLFRINKPVICNRKDAWLGKGYYFWAEEIYAHQWGNTSKRNTGSYEIYCASINCENILDTVFNEAHYNFWREQIEMAANEIFRISGRIPSRIAVNKYLSKISAWNDVSGISFQDIPQGHGLITDFYYRKRIRFVIFNLSILINFYFHKEERCL